MAVGAVSGSQSSNNGSSSNPIDKASAGIDTTFINLLTAELKSQDPTAPMDGNTMVSQMVSLNQLDQLIAIRQMMQQQQTPTTGDTTTQTGDTTGGK